ncbi:MAG: response regulator [Elusimicrobiota bacterium]|nr:response regulator [Elusimicrobiota bacterium]
MAKLLIVDDEPTIRELFKFIFEEAGHEVTLAENGLEALEALEARLPEFMVVDVLMPQMSGMQFMRELALRAEKNPRLDQIPFVVMTGENFMESELNKVFASRPGFICFFAKMTPPSVVLAKIAEILKSRK